MGRKVNSKLEKYKIELFKMGVGYHLKIILVFTFQNDKKLLLA